MCASYKILSSADGIISRKSINENCREGRIALYRCVARLTDGPRPPTATRAKAPKSIPARRIKEDGRERQTGDLAVGRAFAGFRVVDQRDL